MPQDNTSWSNYHLCGVQINRMCQIKNLIICFAEIDYFHMPEQKTSCGLCQLTFHCRDNQLQKQQIVSVNLSYYNTTRSNAQRSVYKSFEHLLCQQSPNRVSPFLPFYCACNKATQGLFLVSENMTHCCQSSPFSHLLKPSAVNHTPHSATVLMSTFSKTIQLRELCYSVSRER